MTTQPPAPFATRPEGSRGRLHDEPESASRTPFQRDRDRIIHCAAFRRLEHKTQVFVHHEGDHYRSRLTHSLEVAQIARSISRVLGLNEDLAEALALAHDLGHTPFGHAGEDALDAAMAPFGGFDHNAQTLRIVTRLEGRYADFDGLNLTWETLEGVVKHNGPMAAETLPETISEYLLDHDLEVATWPGPEAQVAALADDIAYNNHDVDDALRAGLFETGALAGTALAGPIFAEVAERYPGIERQRLIHESVRRLIAAMVEDLIGESRRRIAARAPDSAEAVRNMGEPLIGFSDEMRSGTDGLRRFLFTNMYRHFRLNRMASKARRVIEDLFALFLAEPECLPGDWRQRAAEPSTPATARVVCDYIAGMTDRYALAEHARLFDVTALT
ncbi:MAG: deoxyguanosinetriphosphate triphosphohydrolase [Alphaproteobacteria bacterium]|jgi:dGTPase|nr:deoxyguanosinetriphosphate triphosphohydrolase [Alphaproteobacteria bacterium]